MRGWARVQGEPDAGSRGEPVAPSRQPRCAVRSLRLADSRAPTVSARGSGPGFPSRFRLVPGGISVSVLKRRRIVRLSGGIYSPLAFKILAKTVILKGENVQIVAVTQTGTRPPRLARPPRSRWGSQHRGGLCSRRAGPSGAFCLSLGAMRAGWPSAGSRGRERENREPALTLRATGLASLCRA